MRRHAASIPLLMLLSLTGCALLPRQGPVNGDMLKAGTTLPDVAMIQATPAVVAVLESSKPPSLQGAFGDYRPPREQRIGVGDGVQITLWEAAAGGLFSSPVVDRASSGSRSAVIPEQVVTRDGAITVPFAGRVQVINRTPPQVEAVIVERLADKAVDPQALVTVVRNASNTATVIREGGLAARVPLGVRGDRLLEVLAGSGGGGNIGNSDTTVQITREGRTMTVPLSAVMADPQQNIYVQPGDVIALKSDPQLFTSAGALASNGVVRFEVASLTLDQAVARAGGLLDDRADPAAVFVVRFESPDVARSIGQSNSIPPTVEGVPTIYHFDFRNPSTLFLAHRFPMRSRDILYVANAGYSDIQKVLNMVNLLLTPAFNGAAAQNAIRSR